jgi:hypothetical protein
MILSFAENNPLVTLVDYLNDEFGYNDDDEDGGYQNAASYGGISNLSLPETVAKTKDLNEDKLTDQDFKELKAQQDILKKVSNFYREKATKLGVDRKLIGDFNAAISALEDTIFKADYDKVDETSIVNESMFPMLKRILK